MLLEMRMMNPVIRWLYCALWVILSTLQPSFAGDDSNASRHIQTDRDVEPPQIQAKRWPTDVRELSPKPDNLTERLIESDKRIDALFPSPLEPLHGLWEKGSRTLNEKAGLDLGLNYTILYQYATEAQGPNSAAAGDLDFFGRWNLVDLDGHWPGALFFALEWRHSFTSEPPSGLGDGIGSLWGTTVAYTNQNLSVVQLYWEQGSFEDGLLGRAGKLDPSLIYDGARYVSQNYAFLSPAFSDTPAMPLPGAGLGFAAAVYPSETIYVLGGLHDANGSRTRGFDSIDKGEFFTAIEVGATPNYGKPGAGLYHITLWYSDSREEEGIPRGRGIALTLEQEFGEKGNIVPFLRYSYGDGGATAVRQILAMGIGLDEVLGQNHDIACLGLAWGRPYDSSLRDQYTIETFYRFHLTPHTHLTPDIQTIINPSRAPDQSTVWVFSLRFRTLF
jgi:porin